MCEILSGLHSSYPGPPTTNMYNDYIDSLPLHAMKGGGRAVGLTYPIVQEMHADVAMHSDLGACEGSFGMEKLRAVTGAVICPKTSR